MERVGELGQPDLVILPRTANRPEDMEWLRASGLEAAVRAAAPVMDIHTQGMFDSGEAIQELADRLLERKGLPPMGFLPQSRLDYQEEQFDLLAQAVRENLDLPAIYRAMDQYHERGTSR